MELNRRQPFQGHAKAAKWVISKNYMEHAGTLRNHRELLMFHLRLRVNIVICLSEKRAWPARVLVPLFCSGVRRTPTKNAACL